MLRLPPTEEQPWQSIVGVLREESSELDEFVRARLERNLVDAWRARGARSVPLATRRHPSRWMWISSLALAAGFGALFGLYVLNHENGDAAPPEVLAHFDLVIDDGAVQTGYLTEGQVLESGQHGHIEVALDQSRVDVAPDSRVRFERMARDELRLSLIKGRVEVVFHPERKGEQHMSIETRSARVMVVGTQFSVEVDAKGDTKVSVSEGVVQVIPRNEGETRFVRAGERVDVPVQAEQERVRDVIESHLHVDHVDAEPSVSPASKSEAGVVESRHEGRRGHVAYETTPEERLETARELLLQGKHAAARERLQKIAKKN
ncbi:MAG TPA: FecR family protein, partial [Polyangiales bacterium]|nr:FecR family protein [Polyangiales bacterium]